MSNKNSLIIPIIAIGLLLFASCKKKDNDLEPKVDDIIPIRPKLESMDSRDYFLFHSGNYWKVSYIPGGSPVKLIHITENINSINYFRVVIPEGVSMISDITENG